jgi:hypothetical protein
MESSAIAKIAMIENQGSPLISLMPLIWTCLVLQFLVRIRSAKDDLQWLKY